MDKKLENLMTRYEAGEIELFDTLEKELTQLLKENPNDVQLIHSYGYIHECMGRNYLRKAEKIYETAVFNPNVKGPVRIDGQLMLVRNALGKNKESIELYKKRVLEYPEDAAEYNYLALAYLYADQTAEAKKVIDTLEKVCGPEAIYNETAGTVYSRLGDTEKALELWDKSVVNEFTMGGWFSRAFMFKDLGRLEEAAAEWRKIIKMLEEYHDPLSANWPKEELAKIEAELKK